MGRRAGLMLVVLLLGGVGAEAAPITVRLPEGNSRGFLVLRAPGGPPLAHGELRQRPTGGLVDSQMAFRFKDGSLWDERVTFSQRGVFRLESYRLVQRGPSFPVATEISFERKSGRYRVRLQEKDAPEQAATGDFALPPDLYNGMAMTLLKNLGAAPATTTVQMVAFTPKPRLIKMILGAEGEDTVRVGDETKKLVRYLVKLEVGGLTGLLASLVGKEPPDVRYWLAAGDVPAFVRFEGPVYLKGPVWRIELAPVEWPAD
jgi:hypothetical protein